MNRQQSLKRILNFIEKRGTCGFNDLHENLVFKKATIRYLLDNLADMGYIEKRRIPGFGNRRLYIFLRQMPKERVEIDFTEHYQIFRNMVNYGQEQARI
jgi:predicted transcriptional regulator